MTKALTDTRWHTMRGGIQTDDKGVTHFSLSVSVNRESVGWAQRVGVSADRLRAHPGLYKHTLDMMVRDIGARL